MKLLPYGRVLPVHCCCNPVKRLGWVPLPSRIGPELDARTFQVTFVAGRDARDIYTGALIQAPRIHTEVASLTLVVERGIEHGQETILAVKSADTPIEIWRRIPGFIEDTSGEDVARGLLCVPTLRPGRELRPGEDLRREAVPAADQDRRPGWAEGERAGAGGHEAGAREQVVARPAMT